MHAYALGPQLTYLDPVEAIYPTQLIKITIIVMNEIISPKKLKNTDVIHLYMQINKELWNENMNKN